jgi:prefoldin alpha subunit
MAQNPGGNINPQELYNQYQTVVNQIQYLEQQQGQIGSIIDDLSLSLTTLKGIENNPADSDIILPISNSLLIKASLSGIKEVIVNIGANVHVPMDLKEAEVIINERREEMIKFIDKMTADKTHLDGIASKLQNQLNSMGLDK